MEEHMEALPLVASLVAIIIWVRLLWNDGQRV
jgi:hypothetical protein